MPKDPFYDKITKTCKVNRRQLKKVLAGIKDDIRHDYWATDEQMAAGYCWVFGARVVKELPLCAQQKTVDNFEPAHIWVEIYGRYYDAEHLDGVDDWRKLMQDYCGCSRERLKHTTMIDYDDTDESFPEGF